MRVLLLEPPRVFATHVSMVNFGIVPSGNTTTFASFSSHISLSVRVMFVVFVVSRLRVFVVLSHVSPNSFITVSCSLVSAFRISRCTTFAVLSTETSWNTGPRRNAPGTTANFIPARENHLNSGCDAINTLNDCMNRSRIRIECATC